MKIIFDNMGQWAHPGEITGINSTNITMEGVKGPVVGVDATGLLKYMYPGRNYKFKKAPVIEYPLYQTKGEVNSPYTLDQLKAMAFANNAGPFVSDNTSVDINGKIIASPEVRERIKKQKEYEDYAKKAGTISQAKKSYAYENPSELKAKAKGWIPDPGTTEDYASGIETSLASLFPYATAAYKVATGAENAILDQAGYSNWNDFVNSNIDSDTRPVLNGIVNFLDPAMLVSANKFKLPELNVNAVRGNVKRSAADWLANKTYYEQTHPTFDLGDYWAGRMGQNIPGYKYKIGPKIYDDAQLALKGRPKGSTSNINLIHRTDVVPIDENGHIVFKNSEGKDIGMNHPRPTYHFSTDQSVRPHGYGNWDRKSTTILSPYDIVKEANGKPFNIHPMDTYFGSLDGFTIPASGGKVLTGDVNVYKSLKKSGKYDVEFSQESADLFKQNKKLEEDIEEIMKGCDYDINNASQEVQDLYYKKLDEQTKLGEKNRAIHEAFIEKNGRPTIEDYKALEEDTGLNSSVEEWDGHEYTNHNGKLKYYFYPSSHSNSWLHSLEDGFNPKQYNDIFGVEQDPMDNYKEAQFFFNNAWENYGIEQSPQEVDFFDKAVMEPLRKYAREEKIKQQIKNNNTSKFEIEEYPGVQINPLKLGNPLEKSISKKGDVDISQLKSYISKQKKVYQDIMNKVLEENFKGQNKIDYNEFRRLVQEQLPKYTYTTDPRFESFGIENLGFKPSKPKTDIFFGIDDENYFEKDLTPSTYTFESEGINGNEQHYNENTIGHSRTYTTKNEPQVLYVMESQSDWAQNYKPYNDSDIIQKYKDSYAETEEIINNIEAVLNDEEAFDIEYDIFSDQTNLPFSDIEYISRDEFRKQLEKEKKYNENELEKIKENLNKEKEKLDKKTNSLEDKKIKHMVDTYEKRQIQENLKYAAEHGQTQMRYPTSETAEKIEGYHALRKTYPEEFVKSEEYQKAFKEFQNEYNVKKHIYIDQDIPWWELPEEIENNNPELVSIKKKFDEEIERLAEIKGYKKEYPSQIKTILKRYNDFPKEYKSIFGSNTEVRIITDEKGNTWYEVNVPDSYLQGKAEILMGIGGAGVVGGAAMNSQDSDNQNNYEYMLTHMQ